MVKCKSPVSLLKVKANLIAIVAIDGPRLRFAADANFFDQVFKVGPRFEKGKVDLLDHEMDGEDDRLGPR